VYDDAIGAIKKRADLAAFPPAVKALFWLYYGSMKADEAFGSIKKRAKNTHLHTHTHTYLHTHTHTHTYIHRCGSADG
jgi:hypothetical protein